MSRIEIMSTTTHHSPRNINPPRLENGDRLSRAEFERRYAAMPDSIKAELINGIVYMASPARHDQHGRQHVRFNWFFGAYMIATPGTDAGDNSSLRLDLSNEPQPDVLLRIIQKAGGRSTLDNEGYLKGPPELICEIAASSVSYDLGSKLETYRSHGVQEYVVWRVQDDAIDWFVLRDGNYDNLPPDSSGIIKSEVFPGLWLNVTAMLNDDLAAVQQTLQMGLASNEHQQFVADLAARMAGP